MSFLAGEIITAQRLNRIQPVTYEEQCSTQLTVTTTTYADITGCSITLTTNVDNAVYAARAVYDCDVLETSATVLMAGRMQLDGVSATGVAVYAMDTLSRATIAMSWRGTVASAGSHTFKLQGALTGALATGCVFRQNDTNINVTIYEVV